MHCPQIAGTVAMNLIVFASFLLTFFLAYNFFFRHDFFLAGVIGNFVFLQGHKQPQCGAVCLFHSLCGGSVCLFAFLDLIMNCIIRPGQLALTFFNCQLSRDLLQA